MAQQTRGVKDSRQLLAYIESVDLRLGQIEAYGEVLHRRDQAPELIGLHRLGGVPTIVGRTLAQARRYRAGLTRVWSGAASRQLIADRDLWSSAEDAVRARAFTPWAWTSEWIFSSVEGPRYLARLIGSLDEVEDELHLYRLADTSEPTKVELDGVELYEMIERIYRAENIGGWDLSAAGGAVAP